jgi:ribonuclease HI
MSVSAPHFLLFAHATGNRLVGATAGRHDEVEMEMGGRWRFILQTPEGKTFLDVEDEEEGDSRERLELLAIVRGLEALDQPSQVTLHTNSRAISRGINEGLAQWRENDYQWERFGTMTPIKNRDLWQRVDHAMQIHQVQCRLVSSGGMDDLSLPPPADEQPMKITTRRHRGRERLKPPPRLGELALASVLQSQLPASGSKRSVEFAASSAGERRLTPVSQSLPGLSPAVHRSRCFSSVY